MAQNTPNKRRHPMLITERLASRAAGKLSAERGGGVPRHDSPCGIVLDEGRPVLIERPELHYVYPGAITVPVVEALLTPFTYNGEPVGTVWIIAHDESRKFDNADVKVMTQLGRFASHAYSLLTSIGYLQAVGQVFDTGPEN